MTFEELVKKRPELIEKAKDCDSEQSLKSFFENNGLSIPSGEPIKRIFEFLKENQLKKIDSDSLEEVSGGINDVKIESAAPINQIEIKEQNTTTTTKTNVHIF